MYKKDDPDRPIGRPNTFDQREPRSIPWIWEGVLAEEAVTLLSAPEKIGKTTLLSLLLDRRRAGGQLLGRTVYPGKTLLCSEENRRLWDLRQPPLDFGPELIFHRPVDDFPTRGRWKRFMDDLLTLSFRDNQFDLRITIDQECLQILKKAQPERLKINAYAIFGLNANEQADGRRGNFLRIYGRPASQFVAWLEDRSLKIAKCFQEGEAGAATMSCTSLSSGRRRRESCSP